MYQLGIVKLPVLSPVAGVSNVIVSLSSRANAALCQYYHVQILILNHYLLLAPLLSSIGISGTSLLVVASVVVVPFDLSYL